MGPKSVPFRRIHHENHTVIITAAGRHSLLRCLYIQRNADTALLLTGVVSSNYLRDGNESDGSICMLEVSRMLTSVERVSGDLFSKLGNQPPSLSFQPWSTNPTNRILLMHQGRRIHTLLSAFLSGVMVKHEPCVHISSTTIVSRTTEINQPLQWRPNVLRYQCIIASSVS